LRITHGDKTEDIISSDGKPVQSAIVYTGTRVSIKQTNTGAGGGVRITSMRITSTPVEYINYNLLDGEVIAQKRYDDGGREHYKIKDHLLC
jgi:hypothetical protein